MRDSTVLVVLLLTTVGTARDGKWERVTLGSLTKRGSLLVNLLNIMYTSSQDYKHSCEVCMDTNYIPKVICL